MIDWDWLLLEGEEPKPRPVVKDTFWTDWPDVLVHHALVSVGRLGKLPDAHAFEDMRGVLLTNPCFRSGSRFWRRAFLPSKPEIECLVRGYVIAGTHMDWPASCLDPLIPLFPMLHHRMPSAQFEELVAWTIRNSHNPLVPFGRETKVGTWAEHLRELEDKKARAELQRQRELERTEERRRLSLSKRQRHIEREALARARGQLRQRTIDWLQQLNEGDRLRWLAVQSRLPLGSLPPELFLADQRVILELSKPHRQALLERLQAARHSGGWHKLQHCLRDAERFSVQEIAHVD